MGVHFIPGPVLPAVTPSSYIPGAASVGVAPFGLLDLQTASGAIYHWAERNDQWPAVLADPSRQYGPVNAYYQGWLMGQPRFQINGSTQTDTATLSVQNLSGNTVERDIALAFSQTEFIGALAIYRMWRGDAERSVFTFMGNVTEADIDETQMDLSLEGFGNWSAIAAPAFNVDVSCPLSFGSVQCGSTSATPCNQSYGSCSSIERFMGVIIQWDSVNAQRPALPQIAQPAPLVGRNPARPW